MASGRPREFDCDEALEAAMQMFWEKGFESTTKRDLMDATGVASQSLYNTFGGKRELFGLAIQHYIDTRFAMLEEALNAPGSAIENLRSVVKMWGGAGPGKEFDKGCLLCNSAAEFGRSGDTEFVKLLQTQLLRVESLFAATLERAQEASEIGASINTRALASAMVCTSQGISLLRRVGAPKRMLRNIVEEALRHLEDA